jgi:hypothetical protein
MNKADEKNRKPASLQRKLIFALIIYLAGAFLCFDFSEAAPGSGMDGNGTKYSAGPSPRWPTIFICPPFGFDIPGGASYSGREWLFYAYWPFCEAWRRHHDYALPPEL